MAASGERFSGVALGSIAAGAIFMYAGIKGYSIPNTIKALITGKTPAGQTQATAVSGSVQTTADTTSTGSGNQSVPSGTSGSNEAVMQQVAATFGWTGSEWTALYNVEMAEAGFSLTAQNASGAYGMAQFINGPSEYAQYGGNSTTAAGQATAMCNYIKQRYGTPSAAWAHEQTFHWY